MNNHTKLFSGILLGLVAGVCVTYLLTSPASGNSGRTLSAGIGTPTGSAEANTEPAGERPYITLNTAKNFIGNYRDGNQIMKIGNDTLQGWYIEEAEIDSIMDIAHPGAEGIQFYLARKSTNGDFTLVWVASKDTVISGSNERWLVWKDETSNRSTIREYQKPCPINCPKNSIY